MARGGNVFVLGTGDSVRIADLARRMLEMFTLTLKYEENPNSEVEIHVTGLRPQRKALRRAND